MNRGRLYGLLLVFLGAIGIVVGRALSSLELEIIEVLFVGGCTFVPAGIFLLVAPGPTNHGQGEFTDWFEVLPTKNKVGVYVCAGLGMAAGTLYALSQYGIIALFL